MAAGSRSREDLLSGEAVTTRRVLTGLLALAAALLSDWRTALIFAGVALALNGLSIIADRVTFTFAEGFLPFRLKDGWPHGVQEDDDVRWDWSPTAWRNDRPRLSGHAASAVWDPDEVSGSVRAVRQGSRDQRSPTVEAPNRDRKRNR